MTQLTIAPTATAQWHALVTEAEQHAGNPLGEELQSYLVFLLMRNQQQVGLGREAMALAFLRGMSAAGGRRRDLLRDVGDECLLLSGLYPRIARRRRVRLSYFVDLGRGAYTGVADLLDVSAHTVADLYRHLADNFVALMEVLHATRELAGGAALEPLEAYDLSVGSGSQRARRHFAGRLLITPESERRH